MPSIFSCEFKAQDFKKRLKMKRLNHINLPAQRFYDSSDHSRVIDKVNCYDFYTFAF